MNAALLAEIAQTRKAKARAAALVTTLYGCSDDETVVTLRKAAEMTVAALKTRLATLRYQLNHSDSREAS